MRRTYHFKLKIRDILRDKNMTQKELAELAGIREATLSEMASNSRSVINKVHLAKIMDALDITKLEDILEFSIEEEF
jgi:putative transcriptional regulator